MTRKTDHITDSDAALDRLLDTSTAAPPSPDLKSRILEIARAESTPVDMNNGKLLAFPAARTRQNWLIGSALAASLLLGVLAGISGYADTYISAPLELAGFERPGGGEDNLTGYDMTTGLIPGDIL